MRVHIDGCCMVLSIGDCKRDSLREQVEDELLDAVYTRTGLREQMCESYPESTKWLFEGVIDQPNLERSMQEIADRIVDTWITEGLLKD